MPDYSKLSILRLLQHLSESGYSKATTTSLYGMKLESDPIFIELKYRIKGLDESLTDLQNLMKEDKE
jgi:hypothetical protein